VGFEYTPLKAGRGWGILDQNQSIPTPELFFGFTLWLGVYLFARNSQKITVQLTGWGLIAYALRIIFNQFILIILPGPAL